MSKADDLTEKSLKKLETKIKKEYQQAYDSMRATYDEYINGSADGKTLSLADRFKIEEEKFKAGAYTEKEFESWKLTQIQRGERYKAMVDGMAQRLTDTNKIASAYINDQTPSIYSINQNYQAYEIGKGLEGVSFTLYDEQTVKNLIMDEDGSFTEFRTVKTNPQRDYSWNRDQIKSALVSGILQGKSIDKIADSFMGVMGRNRSSALRNARTAYTSAQNGGRLNGMQQAKAQGINVKKQWLSSHDERVRESHALLNGQIRDLDKRFDNGLMYPADSDGLPAEVYNCRCTLTYIYPKYDKDQSSEIYESEKLKDETYQQFVKRMKKDGSSQIQSNKKRYNQGKDTLPKAEEKKIIELTDRTKACINSLKANSVAYNEVKNYDGNRTDNDIINMISGGDRTQGSCASVGLTYIGQENGMNVLDFRDGGSRDYFSHNCLSACDAISDGKTIKGYAGSPLSACNQLTKRMETDKKYYFVGGRHASVMKKNADGNLEFLELQSATDSGWHTISKKIARKTGYENWFCNCTNSEFFKRRFGASSSSTYGGIAYMVDFDDVNVDQLQEILGYINTNVGEEVKGTSGSIK